MAKHTSEEYASVLPKTQKSKIQTRIELKAIGHIIQNLSPSQKQAIDDIGFGGLLQLRCTHLDHELCCWLIHNFDPTSCSLNVHGHRIQLKTSHVHDLMGLPSNGLDIEFKKTTEGIESLFNELGVVDRVVPLKGLRKHLIETEDAGIDFKRKFSLYILGSLLCPTTKSAIHLYFIHVIKNVECMKEFNWAKLTLDFLVEGVTKYKKNKQNQASGCLFLLMLFYLDQVAPIGEVSCCNSVPRLSYWGDLEIRKRLKQFKDLGDLQPPHDTIHR